MEKIDIVIGAGYGDEGKGITTARLALESPHDEVIVVRFSGGQQAGHSVMTRGLNHIYSHFGSASQIAPTYWSKYCTTDLVALANEHEVLSTKKLKPRIILDKDSPITTPFDIALNQKDKDNLVNGSCGRGVGKTYEREENFYTLRVVHLQYPHIFEQKLKQIHKYTAEKLNADGFGYILETEKFKEMTEEFKDGYRKVLSLRNKSVFFGIESTLQEYDHVIFEGSQGLMLDPEIGFFPNVTRSNLQSVNALNMCYTSGIFFDLPVKEPIGIHYVTRSYATRHGAGPFNLTGSEVKIPVNKYETNETNKFQGDFKTAPLDLDVLRYVIDVDFNNFHRKYEGDEIKTTLHVTCMDLFDNEVPVVSEGKDQKIYKNQIGSLIGHVIPELSWTVMAYDSPELIQPDPNVATC